MALEVLHNLLGDIVKVRNYEKPNIEIKEISTGGANYTSALYTIKVSEAGKEDLHLFAKVAVLGEAARAQMPFSVFEFEKCIYLDLLSAYENLQDKHDVPVEKRLVMPKYYGSNPKQYEETIVLENLIAKGFITYDRFKSMDWDYASKSVEALARLHALSVAHKEHNPEEYNQFMEKVYHQRDAKFESNFKSFYEHGVQNTLPVISEKNRKKVQKYLETVMTADALYKLLQTNQRNVLCHGDYRQSNLMHRINEKGVLELVPVDYQTIKLNPPLTDLFYLIFLGSDEKFRRQYFQKLLDLYYEEFGDTLRRLKVNPDVVYPKRDYEFDIKEYLPYGLAIAILALPVITIEAENAPSMQNDAGVEAFTQVKTGPLFPERINGVINDFIRWGIIE